MIGTRIADYEITAKLGAGGMGVVYRARDTKLNRDVAIKVLPGALTHDHNRMDRFRREAQLLAQLNHPAVAGIHGVEESNGQYALVMELAEGIDLAKRLDSGAIPIDEALPIARQIAEAVEAAHEKGIIHRDLKPANIKVSEDGSVKVLDFGLAKALEGEMGSTTDAEQSPTLTMGATQTGVIMGTAAYMSPEQARGKTADKRADIWSFGVVLCEMLTGRQLFGGETVSDSLAGVLKSEINFKHLPAGTPVSIHRLLRRCLDRDRKRRLQAIGEARIAIEEQIADPTGASMLMEAPTVPRQSAKRNALPWVAAGVLAIVSIVSLIAWWQATRPVEQPLMQFDVDLGQDVDLASDWGPAAILSPDATRLVFVARNSDGKTLLYTRQLSQPDATPLSGTEGARDPFFSPDGEWIGFFADKELKKIAVEGGAAVTVCEAPNDRGGSWGEDGGIIVALDNRSGLSRVSAAGGTPEPVTELAAESGEVTHRWPQILLGGKAVLFTSRAQGGSFDNAHIVVQSLETGERKTLHRGGLYGRYLPSGHLVYVHQHALFAAPIDLDRLELTGPPAPVLEEIDSSSTRGSAQFDFSRTGMFVYLSGGGDSGARTIQWLDSAGKMQPLLGKPGIYFVPRFSPDGKRLALDVVDGSNADVWVYEWERDTMSRLTLDPGRDWSPIWTPDGTRIVFLSRRDGLQANIYWVRADGAGQPQRLTESKFGQVPTSFSPDGKWLAFFEQRPETNWDIWTLPIEGGDAEGLQAGEAELFLGTPSTETNPMFSPDGRWLAYQSDESGTMEIYVRPFPGPGGEWKISNGGGVLATWSPNGRELFYRTQASRIMAATYTAQGNSFAADKPRLWSEARFMITDYFRNFDLAPDGQRFAVLMAANGTGEERAPTRLTLMQNFFDELKRRVPAGGGAGE